MQEDSPTVSSFEPADRARFRVSVCSTAYLPPVSFFSAMMQSGKVLLEAHENYTKQTYRNRCRIATTNGVETLSIPIKSNQGRKIPIRDARISQHDNWRQTHWRAITAAYRSTPFFEYYEDDFRPFYEKEWTFLWDYNMELLILVLDLLDIHPQISLTEEFQSEYSDVNDLRNKIHPKKKSVLKSKPYYQVFENKLGFLPDLSIIDLLFNMGNESILYLLPNFSRTPS